MLIVILFGGLAIFYYNYYLNKTKKYTANNEHNTDINANKNNSEVEIYYFYTDWCPYCKKAKPHWEEIKNNNQGKVVNGYKLYFIDVNCTDKNDESQQLIKKYNVDSFPTIKLVKNGFVIDFDAKPTNENLQKFIDTAI